MMSQLKEHAQSVSSHLDRFKYVAKPQVFLLLAYMC